MQVLYKSVNIAKAEEDGFFHDLGSYTDIMSDFEDK